MEPASAPPHSINIVSDGQGMGRGYSYQIEHQPAFSLAVLKLQPEQSIMAEAGAMVSMSANIELRVTDERWIVRRLEACRRR
jgi:hypothetical protein